MERKLNAEEKRENEINKPVNIGAKKKLATAKGNKDDEFYTRKEDIEKELIHYKSKFKNKTIFMNCDDPEWSNFWLFFKEKQQDWGIKRIISTHYEEGNKFSYGLMREEKGNKYVEEKIRISGDEKYSAGDFRSKDALELMRMSDFVITNPPFSLFREYIAFLINHKKKFIIIGNNNAITYKETFKLIKDEKIWLGKTGVIPNFYIDIPKTEHKRIEEQLAKPIANSKLISETDDKMRFMVSLGVGAWFTNVNKSLRKKNVELTGRYKGNESKYPHYDNYNAINVNAAKDIPYDFKGIMGVPITFLHKLNTNQFEIIGILNGSRDNNPEKQSHPYINGKKKYARLLIKLKEVK